MLSVFHYEYANEYWTWKETVIQLLNRWFIRTDGDGSIRQRILRFCDKPFNVPVAYRMLTTKDGMVAGRTWIWVREHI